MANRKIVPRTVGTWSVFEPDLKNRSVVRIFWVQSMSGFLVRVFRTVKEFRAGLNEIDKNQFIRTQLLTTVFGFYLLCSFIYAPDISTCTARHLKIQVVFTVFGLPLFVSVELKYFSGSRSEPLMLFYT